MKRKIIKFNYEQVGKCVLLQANCIDATSDLNASPINCETQVE